MTYEEVPRLIVSEIFGPTLQGEGPSQGRRAAFIRLGNCNLTCSWCDTPYTWDWSGRSGRVYSPLAELSRQSVHDVLHKILLMRPSLVVITGGEPLLQQTALSILVDRLCESQMAVEIETNGTRPPLDHDSVHYNVSPKLSGATVVPSKSIIRTALTAYVLHPKAIFKFVIANPAELDEVEEIARTYEIGADRIWIMPEGRDSTTLLDRARQLAPLAIGRGWNFTARLHVLLWGDVRGR